MAGVELSGVTRRYGAHVAADAVNLAVADGEFVALRKVPPFWHAAQLGRIGHKRVTGQMYLLKLI